MEVRFQEYVDRRGPDECWPWTGGRSRGGYGVMSRGGKQGPRIQATWVALSAAGRPMPEPGQIVMHSCDNPPCVNPAHLRVGTPRENTADMEAKGRRGPQRLRLCWDNPKTKVGDEQVREIRRRRAAGERLKPLAQEYGVTMSLVSQIARGHVRRHVA